MRRNTHFQKRQMHIKWWLMSVLWSCWSPPTHSWPLPSAPGRGGWRGWPGESSSWSRRQRCWLSLRSSQTQSTSYLLIIWGWPRKGRRPAAAMLLSFSPPLKTSDHCCFCHLTVTMVSNRHHSPHIVMHHQQERKGGWETACRPCWAKPFFLSGQNLPKWVKVLLVKSKKLELAKWSADCCSSWLKFEKWIVHWRRFSLARSSAGWCPLTGRCWEHLRKWKWCRARWKSQKTEIKLSPDKNPNLIDDRLKLEWLAKKHNTVWGSMVNWSPRLWQLTKTSSGAPPCS